MAFDAYHNWLGIPPGEQPPNHYRLLGLTLYESNGDAICNAGDRQMAHIRTFQNGPHAGLSQQLLREIALARICLLDPAKKAEYDEQLRAKIGRQTSATTELESAARQQPLQPILIDEAVSPQLVAAAPPRERRREKNGAIEFAKIALGGLVGIVVSVLLLRYVAQIDVTGLLPLPKTPIADVPSKEPSPVPQANLDQKNPQPPSTPPEVAPPGPIESTPLVPPPAVPGPAVEIEGKAGTESSIAPVTGNTGKASKKKGAKAAADRQWLTPARKAAPTAAQLAKAHEQIAALERPPPKTDQERGTLAANLLAKGKDQQLPDADRYAALEKACELAASAGDAKLLAQAVGALTQAFELDPRPLEGNWLVQAAENVGTAPQVDALLVALQPAIAFAVSEGDFEEALRLADAALAVCQKPQGQQHREWAIWGRQDIARQHAARKTMNDALATLQPDDPAAHLAAAKWLILERNDWPRALPHLARAVDPLLKQAADLDLANPATSEAQLAAADAWHAAGKGPPAEAFCLARALHWYELARRGSLPKPESINAERRIAELRSSRAVAALQLRLKSAVGIGSLSDRLSPAVRRHCVAAFTFEASDLFSANGETTLIDRSGRRHHGRVYGTSPSFGKVGASYLFDGPEDVVECSDAPSLNPTSGLTLCAWVRPQQVSQGTVDYIISKDDWKVGTPRGFVLRLSYRGRPNMTLGSGGWWGPTVREAIKLNEWTHLAGVYDGRQIVVLVNGEEVGQGACAGQPTPSPFDLRIGKGTYDKNRRFQGEIDEVAIFDMALTAADIKTIYELGNKGQSLAN